MEIYSDNGMAARFCTHCGAELTSNANNGGMAVAYMEKEETAKKDERKTVETASTYANAQSSTLQFDTSIPKFDVSSASGVYDFAQETVNEKNRKRAVYVAGGIAAAIIGIAALGFTSGVANIHTEPTTPIVTEVPSEPEIDLVEDTTVEMIGTMVDEDSELISIYYGAEVSEEDAARTKDEYLDKFLKELNERNSQKKE